MIPAITMVDSVVIAPHPPFHRDAIDKLPPGSRYFNISVMWIAYYPQVVRFLYGLRVRHEIVTAMSIATGLTAAGMIIWTRSHGALFVAALLVHLKDLFDACDGALARLTGTGHRLGRFLDTVGDGIVFTALIAAVATRAVASGMPVITGAVWAGIAWLSLFLQCSYFNYYQLNYIARVGGATGSRLAETAAENDSLPTRIVVALYRGVFGWQDRIMAAWDGVWRRWAGGKHDVGNGMGWYTDRRFLTANSALCFGTHAFVLILCMIAARPFWFLPAVSVGMNLYWAGILAARLVPRHG